MILRSSGSLSRTFKIFCSCVSFSTTTIWQPAFSRTYWQDSGVLVVYTPVASPLCAFHSPQHTTNNRYLVTITSMFVHLTITYECCSLELCQGRIQNASNSVQTCIITIHCCWHRHSVGFYTAFILCQPCPRLRLGESNVSRSKLLEIAGPGCRYPERTEGSL